MKNIHLSSQSIMRAVKRPLRKLLSWEYKDFTWNLLLLSWIVFFLVVFGVAGVLFVRVNGISYDTPEQSPEGEIIFDSKRINDILVSIEEAHTIFNGMRSATFTVTPVNPAPFSSRDIPQSQNRTIPIRQ